jgi:SAM-dependent methyltransferase
MPHFFLRLFLASFGRLSRGVQLCFADGPTAGTTLSYAYRNIPEGRLLIGKWIDRRFLQYPGWEQARNRLATIINVLQQNTDALRQQGQPVHLLDIASGPADYLAPLLAGTNPPDTVLCRDRCEKSNAAGTARATAAGWRTVRFMPGDALDRPAMLVLHPKPTLILSVGLYELLDDRTFLESIAIIADLLPPGGRFVLAHQIAHPDPGLVSDLFPRPGEAPAALHLRSPDSLTETLRNAGLTTLDQLPCGNNSYIVLTARKEADGSGTL